jgi:hypothetical protein
VSVLSRAGHGFGIFLLLLLLPFRAFSSTLYVYYPCLLNPLAVEKRLTADFPNCKITVFGRIDDFLEKVKTDRPRIVITKPGLENQLNGYQPDLLGVRNRKTEDSFCLLSTGEPVEPGTLQSKTVGTLDFLGRKGTADFINRAFSPAPKLKRVIKTEDLLPLLIMKMADAILVSAYDIPYFRETSKLDLKVTPVPSAKSGIVEVLTLQNNPDTTLLLAVKKANRNFNAVFGIEQWKEARNAE